MTYDKITFEEITNKGIFSAIAHEVAIAREMMKWGDPSDGASPVYGILFERQMGILRRYQDHIATWDFGLAYGAHKEIQRTLKEMEGWY